MIIDASTMFAIMLALFATTFTIVYSLVKISHLEQEIRRLRIQIREERKKFR